MENNRMENSVKLSNILRQHSKDNTKLNTAYMAIALVVVNKSIEKKKLTADTNKIEIIEYVERSVDMVGNICIVDRMKLKSIFKNVISSKFKTISIYDKAVTINSLVGLDIPVDGEMDISDVYRLSGLVFGN